MSSNQKVFVLPNFPQNHPLSQPQGHQQNQPQGYQQNNPQGNQHNYPQGKPTNIICVPQYDEYINQVEIANLSNNTPQHPYFLKALQQYVPPLNLPYPQNPNIINENNNSSNNNNNNTNNNNKNNPDIQNFQYPQVNRQQLSSPQNNEYNNFNQIANTLPSSNFPASNVPPGSVPPNNLLPTNYPPNTVPYSNLASRHSPRNISPVQLKNTPIGVNSSQYNPNQQPYRQPYSSNYPPNANNITHLQYPGVSHGNVLNGEAYLQKQPMDNPFGNSNPPKSYQLDHLATFTNDTMEMDETKRGKNAEPKKQQSILSPLVCLQKLNQLSMNSGIFTLRVRLSILDDCSIIVDEFTREIIEKFPLNSLINPVCIPPSNDPRADMYNNVIVFSIVDANTNESHLFQSLVVPGVEVVKDIIEAQKKFAAKGISVNKEDAKDEPLEVSSKKEADILGRNQNPNSNQVSKSVLFSEGVIQKAVYRKQEGPKASEMLRKSIYQGNDSSLPLYKQKHDKTEVIEAIDRKVMMLDHCLTDIEKFSNQLQQAALAYLELGRRKTVRGNKGGIGDGILASRSKTPSVEAFIDIFQKFKLALVLIAKMKKIIVNPNASELIRYLFDALHQVVETSSDPQSDQILGAIVKVPLVTPEVYELLDNCLNTRDTQLWTSLGSAWRIPSNKWSDDLPSFQPIFYDGWSPPNFWLEEIGINVKHQKPSARPNNLFPSHFNILEESELNDAFLDLKIKQNNLYQNASNSSISPNASNVSTPENTVGIEAGGLKKVAQKSHSPLTNHDTKGSENLYTEVNKKPKEPSDKPNKGESAIGTDDSARKVKTPKNILKVEPSVFTPSSFLKHLKKKNAKIVKVLADRTGNNEKELTIKKDEILEVLKDDKNWWKVMNYKKIIGHAPKAALSLII